MMKTKNLASILCFSLLLSFTARGAIVSGISCTQRWPWNGKVDIDFNLFNELEYELPVFKLGFYGQIGDGPSFPLKSITGDVNDHTVQEDGWHRVTWDAYQDLGATVDASDVKVAIVARETTIPPPYMYLDLNTYELKASFRAPSPNDPATKRTQVWFRRVEAGTFTMGASSEDRAYFNASFNNESVHRVTITKPFYIAVYQTTEAQYYKIDEERQGWESMKPMTGLDYSDLRGDNIGTNWPARGYSVDANSFFGKLRSKVGGDVIFDLPTDAQWEMACRSKGDGTFHGNLTWSDGSPYAKVGTGSNQDTNLVNISWYSYNAGSRTHDVGTRSPSTLGLYDMHGNVWEWCLDWMQDNLGTDPVTDPVGPRHQISGNSLRVRRGGAFGNNPADCRPARRNPASASSQHTDYGFRMVLIQ
jgi:formylglycine-generating enzyme required for sulfatase activity